MISNWSGTGTRVVGITESSFGYTQIHVHTPDVLGTVVFLTDDAPEGTETEVTVGATYVSLHYCTNGKTRTAFLVSHDTN